MRRERPPEPGEPPLDAVPVTTHEMQRRKKLEDEARENKRRAARGDGEREGAEGEGMWSPKAVTEKWTPALKSYVEWNNKAKEEEEEAKKV